LETGADMVAVDADGGVDELDLDTQCHGVVVGERSELGVDGVDQPGEETLNLLVGAAGADSGHHRDKDMGRIAVGNPEVAALGRSGSERVECSETIVERSRVNRVDQRLDVVDLGEVGTVLDDDVGHGSLRQLLAFGGVVVGVRVG